MIHSNWSVFKNHQANFKGGIASGRPLVNRVFIMQMSEPLKGTVLISRTLALNFCTVRSATQCAC